MNFSIKNVAKHICFFFIPNSKSVISYSEIKTTAKYGHDIVYILGWGGAKRQSLNKIVSFYNSIGIHTILHVMPLGVPAFLRHEIKYFDMHLVFHTFHHFRRFYETCIIEDYNTAQNALGRPLSSFCHIYSNNGV